VDFTVSSEEVCYGSPALRTGQAEIIKDLINKNLDYISRIGANTVITACAGCYRTFKIDYPKILGKELPFKVLHISEFLSQIIPNNNLKLKNDKSFKIAYHDPCHLGRHSGVFDEPRNIISSIENVEFIEMHRNRENAWYCGAGGGVKSGFKDWAVEIASERIKEAEKTGADILITNCPFCVRNLKDASNKLNSNLKIMGIVELIKDLI